MPTIQSPGCCLEGGQLKLGNRLKTGTRTFTSLFGGSEDEPCWVIDIGLKRDLSLLGMFVNTDLDSVEAEVAGTV